MTLEASAVHEICKRVSRQVRGTMRDLTIHYVVHYEGQRREALAMAAQEILSHPAAETSIHLLQKARKSEESAILGTAVALRSRFFGLSRQFSVLSVCTINLSQFRNLNDTHLSAWHLAWHAIDSARYHAAAEHNNSERPQQLILRRRNALQMAHANLRADVFATIMCTLLGDPDAIRRMAVARSHHALTSRALHNPEFYPFVLAMEPTEFALSRLADKIPTRRQMIPTALKLSNEIGRMIDMGGMRNWLSFCEPSQDMAWRGFSKEDILGAAISTSENLHVRSTGYLVSELTRIAPKSMVAVQDRYSPFADDGFNRKLHERAVEAIFEDVIAQGVRANSADPFAKTANMQNQSMTEGQILGWCAGALQAAGQIYQRALDSGNESEAEALARQEFRTGQKQVEWDNLRSFGKRVVREQRKGEIVTISTLAALSAEDKDTFGKIGESVKTTINSPEFQEKLQAARDLDLAPRGPAPAAPGPRGPAPAAPAPAPMAAPGLGRSANVRRTAPAQTTRQPPPQEDSATGHAE